MLKPYLRYARFAVLVVPLLVVMLLLVSSTPTLARAPAAPTVFYQCTPSTVGVFTNRIHVLCTVPYNGTIGYFGYCSAGDSATASRLLSVFTAAKALGKNVGVYFDPNDTSGAACGCQSTDCRVVSGAEIRP
jgi:hypothetical protein